MKILVDKESLLCDDDLNFSVSATFESNEDTTSWGVLNMVYDAMKLETFNDQLIIQSMYDVAIEKANAINYAIKQDESEGEFYE